jgi:acyl-coenzyme A synthetase/AMP-(fatty) acid ligase
VTSPEGRREVTGTLPTARQHDDLDFSIDRPVDPSSPALAPDVALVMRTSGTTGKPKPVLLTHEAYLNGIDTVIAKLRERPAGQGADRRPNSAPATNLIPTSLALSAGIYNTLFAFRVGADVVLIDRFSTSEFAHLVRTFGIRSTVLAPAMITMLADDGEIESLAPLRFVRSITAPLLATEAKRFEERFGVSVLNSYGQTELGGEVVGWTAADWRNFGQLKLGSIGRPHDGIDVKILGPDGLSRPDGETGDIWIRSPYLMRGYATASHMIDDRLDHEGYLRTGDLGHYDTDGFLWIDGRESDMINRGGPKTSKLFSGSIRVSAMRALPAYPTRGSVRCRSPGWCGTADLSTHRRCASGAGP